jgi:predicted nuclease of predicted toxin-antitoxin system
MGEIRIYTDESVDVAIAKGLQRRGIDAFSARERDKFGLTDEEQLIFAKEEKGAIFTHDADFLRIAVRWVNEGKTHCGVIYCHQTAYGIGDCIRNLKILATVLALSYAKNMISNLIFRDDLTKHFKPFLNSGMQ